MTSRLSPAALSACQGIAKHCACVKSAKLSVNAVVRNIQWPTSDYTPVSAIPKNGRSDVYAIQISDDGESYYYTYQQAYSDLYLVDGLR